MKDHLNVVNTLANAKKNIDFQSLKSQESNPNRDKTGKIEEDSYDTLFKNMEYYDESIIEGMNLENALEYTGYIKDQALVPEGRQMMSLAHNSISTQQVSQLLGLV